MDVGRKERALAFYVSIRICFMLLISKSRGESDLGLCPFLGLAKTMQLRGGDFRFKSCLAAKILFSILKLETYGKIIRKNWMLVHAVCFRRRLSASRMFATSKSRLEYYRPICSCPPKRIRWNASWTGFHSNPRLFVNTPLYLSTELKPLLWFLRQDNLFIQTTTILKLNSNKNTLLEPKQ